MYAVTDRHSGRAALLDSGLRRNDVEHRPAVIIVSQRDLDSGRPRDPLPCLRALRLCGELQRLGSVDVKAIVTPAKAGVQGIGIDNALDWIPACAGMTASNNHAPV